MASRDADILVRDLIRLLNSLLTLHGDLAAVMREKIEAMKQADSDRIAALTAQETQLVNRAVEREGFRRQLMRRVLEVLGLDVVGHETVRLSQLAPHLHEPTRSLLLAAAEGLRGRLAEVESLRVTTVLITEHMLHHMREILSVMRSGGEATGVYSPTGQTGQRSVANVFEAVG